jgi:hypothetical protein
MTAQQHRCAMDVCALQGADVAPTPAGLCRTATYDFYEDAGMQPSVGNDEDYPMASQLCRTATYDPYKDAGLQPSIAKYDDCSMAPELCRCSTYDPVEDVDVHPAFGWVVALPGPVLFLPLHPCMIVCPGTAVGVDPPEASALQRTTTYDPYEDVGVWPSDVWGGSTCSDDASVSGVASDSDCDLSIRPRRGPFVRPEPTVSQGWLQMQARLDEVNDPFLMSSSVD